jgi:predicted aldo/keto reductase-like oxidoreductase
MTLWEADSIEYLETKFNESLKKLQTDYIDFYLLHSLNEFKYDKAKAVGAVEWAMEKKKEGKIKYVGFSIHDSVELLRKVLDDYSWDFAQIQYNYMDTDGEPGEAGYFKSFCCTLSLRGNNGYPYCF